MVVVLALAARQPVLPLRGACAARSPLPPARCSRRRGRARHRAARRSRQAARGRTRAPSRASRSAARPVRRRLAGSGSCRRATTCPSSTDSPDPGARCRRLRRPRACTSRRTRPGGETAASRPRSAARGSSRWPGAASAAGRADRGRRRPAASSRRSRRARICTGDRIRMRAAASSMASGRPSRRAQISAMVAGVVGGQRERWLPAAACRTNSATAGLSRQRLPSGGRRGQVRHRQRRHVEALLAGDAQHRAAGHQHRQRRASTRAARRAAARAARQLLEVVEHEQRARANRAADVVAKRLVDRSALDAREAERLRERRPDVVGVGHRAEPDEVDAAGKLRGGIGRDLQREPRLAAAARARTASAAG